MKDTFLNDVSERSLLVLLGGMGSPPNATRRVPGADRSSASCQPLHTPAERHIIKKAKISGWVYAQPVALHKN